MVGGVEGQSRDSSAEGPKWVGSSEHTHGDEVELRRASWSSERSDKVCRVAATLCTNNEIIRQVFRRKVIQSAGGLTQVGGRQTLQTVTQAVAGSGRGGGKYKHGWMQGLQQAVAAQPAFR